LGLLFARPERQPRPRPAFAPRAVVEQTLPVKATWEVLAGDEGGQSWTSRGADGKIREMRRRNFRLAYTIAGWEGYVSGWISGEGNQVLPVLVLHEGT
jgi:hypothetical protein